MALSRTRIYNRCTVQSRTSEKPFQDSFEGPGNLPQILAPLSWGLSPFPCHRWVGCPRGKQIKCFWGDMMLMDHVLFSLGSTVSWKGKIWIERLKNEWSKSWTKEIMERNRMFYFSSPRYFEFSSSLLILPCAILPLRILLEIMATPGTVLKGDLGPRRNGRE